MLSFSHKLEQTKQYIHILNCLNNCKNFRKSHLFFKQYIYRQRQKLYLETVCSHTCSTATDSINSRTHEPHIQLGVELLSFNQKSLSVFVNFLISVGTIPEMVLFLPMVHWGQCRSHLPPKYKNSALDWAQGGCGHNTEIPKGLLNPCDWDVWKETYCSLCGLIRRLCGTGHLWNSLRSHTLPSRRKAKTVSSRVQGRGTQGADLVPACVPGDKGVLTGGLYG